MDFIFTWIIKVVCYLIAIPFDIALSSIGQVFTMDGIAFLAVFGSSALSYYNDLFMPMAYSLLAILFLFSITKGLLPGSEESSVEAPLMLVVRLGLCFFAIKNALPILQLIRSFFSVAFDWIAVEISTHETIRSQLDQVGTAIGEYLYRNNIDWDNIEDISGLASGTVGLLLSTIFLIPVYFRIIRIMVTFAARYVLRCVLELMCPLPFACGVSRSTSNILSNYIRLYVGVLVSTIISAFIMKLYWAGAALLTYNMIYNISQGVITMFLIMGMYELYMKIDTYVNQIGLHGMAPMADRRATLGSVMQSVFGGMGLYKYLKGLGGSGGGLGGGWRMAPNPRNLPPDGYIPGRAQPGLSMKASAHAGSGMDIKSGTKAMGTPGALPMQKQKPSMTVGRASGILGAEYMRSGHIASQAFRTLMPGVAVGTSVAQQMTPGAYKGALISSTGIKPLTLRKNQETGAWEGAPIELDGGISEVRDADYRPISELASEFGAQAVSIGNGEDGMQFGIQAGETFTTSKAEKGFDRFVASHSEPASASFASSDVPAPMNTSISTDAFGEQGHIMATKVGNNSMQGYYYSSKVGHVEGVKASVISKEEYDHNPARAVKLNNGMYLRFHKSDPDAAISKAAASVEFKNGRFVRKGGFSLKDDGSLEKK